MSHQGVVQHIILPNSNGYRFYRGGGASTSQSSGLSLKSSYYGNGSNGLIDNLHRLPAEPEVDPIVICILERGMERASEIHGFRLNTTGERRPDLRQRRMKAVVDKLKKIGYQFERN